MAIRAFWRREGALTDDTQTDQRLPQLVMHARTRDGEVAGVCTAVPVTLPRLGQPAVLLAHLRRQPVALDPARDGDAEAFLRAS